MAQKLIETAQKKRYRSWIILGTHKQDGHYVGITEHSFSMGYSKERIRVEKEWEVLYCMKNISEKRKRTTDHLKHMRESMAKYAKRYPEYSFEIYRTGTKKCPITINWDSYHKDKKDKFNGRNLLFKPKLDVTGIF